MMRLGSCGSLIWAWAEREAPVLPQLTQDLRTERRECSRRVCSACSLWPRLLAAREVGTSPLLALPRQRAEPSIAGDPLDIHPQRAQGRQGTRRPGFRSGRRLRCIQRACGARTPVPGRTGAAWVGRGGVLSVPPTGPGETRDSPAACPLVTTAGSAEAARARVARCCSCWGPGGDDTSHPSTRPSLRDDGKPDAGTRIEQKGILGTATPQTASVPSPTQRSAPVMPGCPEGAAPGRG